MIRASRRPASSALTALLSALLVTACGTTVDTRSAGSAHGGTDTGIPGPAAGAAGSQAAGGPGTDVIAGTPSSVGTAVAAPGGVGTTAVGSSAQTGSSSGVTGAGVAGDKTPIRLGFPVLKNGNVLLAGFGTTVSFGDGKAQVEAIVSDLNKHGGMNGRPVHPFYAEVDVAAPDAEANYLAACAKLTEDDRVFAVLTPINPPQSFVRCVAKHQTLLLNASFNPTDDVLQREVRDWFFSPSLINLNRGERILLDELRAAGKLGKPVRVGLLISEKDPAFVRVTNTVVVSTLKGWGLPYTLQGAKDYKDSSAISSAALKFRSDGVTLVLFVAPNGLLQLQFLQAAEDQGYRPSYGLTDYDSVKLLSETAPRAQMQAAFGVGSLPVSNVPPSQYPENAQEKACLQVMRAAGIQGGDRNANLTATLYCELVRSFAVVAALVRGPLTSAKWRAAYPTVTNYQPISTFTVDFRNGRTDNASSYRLMSWADACSCVTYKGGLRRAP
jgi:hypothetical protein